MGEEWDKYQRGEGGGWYVITVWKAASEKEVRTRYEMYKYEHHERSGELGKIWKTQ